MKTNGWVWRQRIAGAVAAVAPSPPRTIPMYCKAMRRNDCFLFLLFFLIASPSAASDLARLSFLSGCWVGEGSVEMWMKPEAGSMLGMGRTIRNGKVTNTEFFSVAESKNGVTLTVQLKFGGQVTVFKAKEIGATSVTFENPEHDYPQRVIYRRNADGSLLGRIEGVSKGKERAFDYPMRRARCEE